MKPADFKEWFKRLLSGQPHFVIGGTDSPYMCRWYLIPRNLRFNVYLHKFMRDDDDRALHDHPWWFISLILSGRYKELTEKGVIYRRAGSIGFRHAEHRHRVVLYGDAANRRPCWTIVVTGRKARTWGSYCPKGFVPWYDFVAQDDHGNVGRGCE
jgi:hypothetical protein